MMSSSQSIPIEPSHIVNESPQTVGRKSMGVSGSEYQRRRIEPLNGGQETAHGATYDNYRGSGGKIGPEFAGGYCQKFNPD